MDDSVDLGPDLETYVADLVRDGRYGSRLDLLREGVRLLESRDRPAIELDLAIARGLTDAEAGRVSPSRSVAERLTAKYKHLSAQHGA